ncbi:maltose/galactoside acetyltransferase [Penicillium nucicola]|uniref:maltose/galactoside acetyltransferase n=1 Tax=Penicillium nucicola TaxID=1850975 RepID=UPI002545A28F|nr:maltose/galactoside acetyltransferase [Penicillium nucicola]KAJ5747712.1 maltose/galactoside acetyltransferase [Penicillium nucicola]
MTKQTSASQKSPEILQTIKGWTGILDYDLYDQMVSGMLYYPMDTVLVQARLRCRKFTRAYNNMDLATLSPQEALDQRLQELRKFVGKVGDGTVVESPFMPDYGCNVSIGENTFINFNCTILDTSIVVIGNGVQIASNVSILSAGHETSVLSRQKFLEFGLPVYIEDDVWLGANVIIMHGVTIGKGSTVGAGSTVTKDIPPYCVVVGTPARVIKTIPTPEEEMLDPDNPFRKAVAVCGKYATSDAQE